VYQDGCKPIDREDVRTASAGLPEGNLAMFEIATLAPEEMAEK
jgi:hypothetical protein